MDIQPSSKEEFLANYLDQNVLEKSLTAHIHRIVNCFITTGSIEKGKSSGRPKVMEDVVEKSINQDHLETHPRTSLTRLSLQTAVLFRPKNFVHPFPVISQKLAVV
jgi:hypothetical protein